jgi:hypothetical protein
MAPILDEQDDGGKGGEHVGQAEGPPARKTSKVGRIAEEASDQQEKGCVYLEEEEGEGAPSQT